MLRSTLWGLLLVLGITAGPAAAQCDAPIDLGEGQIAFHVPDSYDPGRPTPLIVLLHGYGAGGALQEAYLRFTPLSDEFGFLYAYPDGIADAQGNRFWNATDACCDLFGNGFDHSSYLRQLVDTIRSQCNVDPYRIFFAGHSNGGFMSYRMACDHAEVVSGMASLAGATFANPLACTPSRPVHALQIHGTADATILFEGGDIGGVVYPGAIETAQTWAGYNQCSPTSETLAQGLDLDSSLAGRESVVRQWVDGCRPGGSAELWSIQGGSHVPAISRDFRRGVIEHLLAHPRCRDKELLKRPKCSAVGTLKLKLRRGVPGDVYGVELSNGELIEGELNRRGQTTLRLRDQPAGRGEVTVTWGCGAMASRAYRCSG